jgi:DNA-binding response OmpR family regulator
VGIKILLADDSVTAQNMGKKILSEAGHEVVTVSNGAAAAKKIAEIKPDLVLLDVFMPGYSGLELCERLRNAADTTKMPVLLTVGRMEPYSPQDGARVKADGVIIKPFEATDLTAAVERLASGSKPSKTLAWKAESKSQETSSTPDPKAAQKPNNHDQTMRLDPAEIAAILAGKPSTPAKEASTLIDPAAEEFNITPIDRREIVPSNTATPAFADDLVHAPTPAPASSAAMVPAFAVEELAPVASPEPIAAQPAANDFSVQRFDVEAEAALVGAAEGLELTAAAPVPEMPIAIESALEPTLQSVDPNVIVSKDPALETNPHQAASDFPTQFGTSEPAADPVIAKHHVEVSQSVVASSDAMLDAALSSYAPETPQAAPPDEFEARLQAAMSAYEQPEAQIEPVATVEEQLVPAIEHEMALESTPSFHVAPEPSSLVDNERIFSTTAPAEIHAVKPNYPAAASLPEIELSTEEHTSDIAREFTPLAMDDNAAPQHSELPSTSLQEDAKQSIADAADEFLKSVSGTQAIVADPEMAVVEAPETDDIVIEQMRDALSELPIEHHPAAEIQNDSVPKAMAAAATFNPASGNELDTQVAHALSSAMIGGASSPTHAGHSDNGDANHVASAVDHVLQRELPSLVGKIMAELDLRKNRK